MGTNTSITISDVAKHAGVSKSTVSNYLNGKYDKMAAETKSKIDQVVKELGYTPNLSARRLPNKEQSRIICLIIPRNLTYLFDSMYYPTVFHAIEKLAEKMDYHFLIYTRNRSDWGDEMFFLKGLAASMVDGFIIFDLEEHDMFFKEFEMSGIPYVCVGKIDDYEDYHYVASNHKKAMEDTMEHLIGLGHRRFGIFNQAKAGIVTSARKRIVERVCQRYQIGAENIVDIEIPFKSTDQEMYDYLKSIFIRPDRPTAYIITSAIRHPFLLAAQDLGLTVPTDLSYVNIEYYRKNNTSVENQTRVEMRVSEIAELAFKKLLRSVFNPASEFQSQMITLDLTIGTTTSEPNRPVSSRPEPTGPVSTRPMPARPEPK